MKKFILSAGIIVATLCCILGFAACGGENGEGQGTGEHSHVWGEWTEETAPTCTQEGLKKRTCETCGADETLPVEKLAHSYTKGWETVKEATCTEEGSEQNVCDMCHEGQTRPIEKKAHAYGDWYPVVESTCSSAGVQRRNCIVCNTEGSDDKAYETKPLEKLPHTEQQVEKAEANCLTAGHEAGVVCAVCGEVVSGMEEIPALGHALGEVQHLTPSTCTVHGVDVRACTHEGCEYTEETELEYADHARAAIGEARDATCTADGITAGEWCTECREVFEEQESIPMLGHDLSYTFSVQEESGSGEPVCRHTAKCTRENCFFEEEQLCELDSEITAATCTEAEHHVHTCKLCEHAFEHDEGTALGHNFGSWYFDVEAYDESLRDEDGTATVVRQHRRVCSNAGHKPDPNEPDVETCGREAAESVPATCTSAGYTNYRCPTCEAGYTDDKESAKGHTWEKDGNKDKLYSELYHGMWVHYKKCTVCEQNGTYFACRYETAQWKAADCEHGKTLLYTCVDCGQEHSVEQGAPLGHTYGGWTHDAATSGDTSRHYRECGRCAHKDYADCVMQSADKVATCQKPGREIQICKDCKYTEEGGEIEKLQHDVEEQPYIAERSQKSHYRVCKRCSERVYEACPYTLSTTPMTCTEDEKTTYTCPDCKDSYTTVSAKSKGHEVTVFTASDAYTHTGQCNHCKETVAVPHDFSQSNICTVCERDGLAYAFVGGSSGPKTQAKVTRNIDPETHRVVNIDTPKVVIPEEVDIDGNGLVPVVAVGLNAFYQNTSVEEVVLPKNLEQIDAYAFAGCKNLARVSIAGHNIGETNIEDCALNRIEDSAFENCTSLTNAILPKTLQYIGKQAFRGCSLLAEINIPEKVTEIQDHAFTDTAYFNDPAHWLGDMLYIGPHLIRAKTALAGACIVRDGTVSISAEAFKDCKELTHITLPAELKAIDADAFLGCDMLDTVVFKGTFAQYLGIRFDNDAASPMHFAKELTIAGAEGAPHIPEGTTVIPAGAFKGSKIESIVIPASVTSIGAQAFYGCELLESITFAAGSKLISVGTDTVMGTKFYGTETNWSDGVLYLREEGTDKAIALVAVDESKLPSYEKLESESGLDEGFLQAEIEEGTLCIAPRAFAGIAKLRCVSVASTVVFIGAGAFEGCAGLDRVNFRRTGSGWFCYSPSIGRVYADADVYGGESGEDYARQKRAADMFELYILQWRKVNG